MACLYLPQACMPCEPETCMFCAISSSIYINELHLTLSLQSSLYLEEIIYFKEVKLHSCLYTGISFYVTL